MSLYHILKEQIVRSEKNIQAYQKKVDNLPKGSIHIKKRGNKKYYYRKYRDDNGIRRDEYIKEANLSDIIKKIEKRKEYIKMIKSLQEDIKVAKKGLK